MSIPTKLSSLLLATSLLFTGSLTGGCSTTTRGGADAGVAHPVRGTDPDRKADLDRAALRALLIARREQSVARFLAYREARVYPINSYEPGLQHVWLDAQGRLCAAATLISADWGYDVAAAVAIDDNFIQLADVKDGPLADWMLTSGLTHHELVAIQEPMMYPGDGGFGDVPVVEPQPIAELERLYSIYVSVERQLDALWDESLDEAVDALVRHPDLARSFLAGEMPGAGRFATIASGGAVGFEA